MSLTRRDLLKFGSVVTAGLTFDGLFTPFGGIGTQIAQAATPDITHGPRSGKEIALTFHGAGSGALDNQLLDIFKSTNTPVTVFAIGSWLKANPAIASRIVSEGHDIANHTMNHYQMKTLSAAKVASEISGCAAELTKLVGNQGSFFRPSGTQYSNAIIRKAALKHGYGTCISYDVDSLDYTDPGAAAVHKNVMTHLRGGSIVSMHFGHQNTLEVMPGLLKAITAKGFKPVTLSTLLKK